MKPLCLQQEILLITNSEISRRQLAGKSLIDGQQCPSDNEQLEEACRNGLLDEIIPESIEKRSYGKKLQLWQIRSGTRFLHIELCTFPIVIEHYHSIDPYLFMPLLYAN